MPAARLPKLSDRASGVLLHPTSLPGAAETGGDLGHEAQHFVDFLAAADQRWWQMLPVGPTGYGNSPYSAQSAFAGSPALVSVDRLIDDGLLSRGDREQPRDELLRAAFAAFRARRRRRRSTTRFAAGAAGWLDDFALYRALKRAHGGVQWTRWPAGLRDRDPGALAEARGELADDIAFARFVQWRFDRDWRALRSYAHERGVGLIGDIPIFVAHDSADVWRDRELFTLGARGEPAFVAGVPPDYFSSTGQRWGNPLYRWDRMRKTGYAWWIERFRATLAAFDAVRLDHFIGFGRYWEIPGGEPTAVSGRWRAGPGAGSSTRAAGARWAASCRSSPRISAWSRPRCARCATTSGCPGIKILQFAFGNDPNGARLPAAQLPAPRRRLHGHARQRHGWSAGSTTRAAARAAPSRPSASGRPCCATWAEHPSHADARDIHWEMIRAVLASVANVAIMPVQDLLGLGSEARMNRPGTAEGNWAFRLAPGALTPALARSACAT